MSSGFRGQQVVRLDDVKAVKKVKRDKKVEELRILRAQLRRFERNIEQTITGEPGVQICELILQIRSLLENEKPSQ